MIELIPEDLEFQSSTTGVEITYSEQEGLSIQLTVIKDNKTATATILFPIVAEFECVGVNLYELKYGDLKIVPSPTAKADSAFYRNGDKNSYAGKLKTYDPKHRFGLEEYYIPGNDSFIRIIASKYHVQID
ncbi:hypothetical protein [Paracidovorax oryzae]|uniref:hypothetical protein n=1 Tax=Paracidovorax oryzae TaxID=862720 RepID=UPI0012FEF033|nr:hypothetical protein [Paracidovorax oryzae]